LAELMGHLEDRAFRVHAGTATDRDVLLADSR